jgi:hypothetical protein
METGSREVPASRSVCQTIISRSVPGKGNGRRMTACIMLNVEHVRPTASASVTTTIVENAG